MREQFCWDTAHFKHEKCSEGQHSLLKAFLLERRAEELPLMNDLQKRVPPLCAEVQSWSFYSVQHTDNKPELSGIGTWHEIQKVLCWIVQKKKCIFLIKYKYKQSDLFGSERSQKCYKRRFIDPRVLVRVFQWVTATLTGVWVRSHTCGRVQYGPQLVRSSPPRRRWSCICDAGCQDSHRDLRNQEKTYNVTQSLYIVDCDIVTSMRSF